MGRGWFKPVGGGLTCLLILCGLARGVPSAGGEVTGSSTCASCHSDEAGHYKATRHGAPFLEGKAGQGCESCHGPGGAHAENPAPGNIVNRETLKKMPASEKNAICLRCHAGGDKAIRAFNTSSHRKADVSCWDCHAEVLHASKKPAASENKAAYTYPYLASNPSERCLACHEEIRSDFALQFRHPVQRGQVTCWDCHEVHGSDKALSSRGAELNAVCLRCHREQKGPFVWRHLAMDDGCTSCHRPHGSVNDKLLAQWDNALCLSCHYETSFPAVGGRAHRSGLSRGARCFDCHAAQHGSNVSKTFQR